MSLEIRCAGQQCHIISMFFFKVEKFDDINYMQVFELCSKQFLKRLMPPWYTNFSDRLRNATGLNFYIGNYLDPALESSRCCP